MKTRSPMAIFFVSQVLFGGFSVGSAQDWNEIQTIAEKSDFTATSTHAEVIEFQETLAELSPQVTNQEIGLTVNGRSMLATIVAKAPYQLGNHDDPRLRVLLLGNIHSGECAGKEGLLILMRELAQHSDHRWLDNMVVVFLPNYNADGNDRIGRNEIHRRGQMGPAAGMGLRENSQQLDLNRDFVKIDSPEGRSLVGLIDKLNPHLFIDCHTTNGSRHRYQLTYDVPHNPTAPAALKKFLRNDMMPAITRDLEKKGISTFYYGNFSRDQLAWKTYGHQPRYSTEYVGLRGRLSILSEAYSYISYKERIQATAAFVTQCLDYVDDHRIKVIQLLDGIQQQSRHNSTKAQLSLGAEVRPFKEKFKLKGYDGSSDTPKDHDVLFFGDYAATQSKTFPFGYVLSDQEGRVVDRLLMHGIKVFSLTATHQTKVDHFSITKYDRSPTSFQGHQMVTLDGKWETKEANLNQGDYFVPTDQPLGRLAGYLLEPQSDDGFSTWNFFDGSIDVGLNHPVTLLSTATRLPLVEVSQAIAKAKLTLAKIYGANGSGDRQKIPFGGQPPTELKWIDQHQYKTSWNGREVAVDAETGKLNAFELSPQFASSRLLKSGLRSNKVKLILQGKRINLIDAVVFNSQNDLYWVHRTDDLARQLTSDPIPEEWVTPSPDQKQLAFIKNNDLYRIDLETGKVLRVTTDGNENRLNGKLDWVYQEELFGRGNFKGFWWSPNSKNIAYLTLDQSSVNRYRVTDHIPVRQTHEVYPYPKAGDPNPVVGICIDGKKLNLEPLGLETPLISQVCWSPSNEVFFQIQNRIQNVIKLVKWAPGDPSSQVVVEETSPQGWLRSPGNPVWQNVNSKEFIWFTHRGGKRHIATYRNDGALVENGKGKTQRKDDALEVRSFEGLSEDAVYFTAAMATDATKIQLYRLGDTGDPVMITRPQFNHSIEFSPDLRYFFDTRSQTGTPSQTALMRSDGTFMRFIRPNLVDHLDYFDIVAPQYHRVPTRDGDQMDAMIIYPPDFDDSKKYPVIMHVYAGPQAPRVRKRWGGQSYLWHQMMAQRGFIIWMCDNRSATYRGLDKTYPIYQDLGRRELADIEDSLTWLKKQEGVDADRIGIWGWSYGGYMTGYAMTHSKSFKAGISGAPVTDWRNYDSIYTERYMGLPAENKKGYQDSSVINAAGNLHGRLLLIHGTQDDNVHISNTYQLIHALQEAGKEFDLMIYPKNRHGIRTPNPMRHLRQLMTDFFTKNL
ncbi:DPP IV N-terminal domain-containing protein [Mariniblastus sp.]|nr:DPP IV N-terminal domain-containing protein [Mariniblastus sp.]MDB4756131.1 DPP IV N-terminal domain-containing protein [Mariniblastus sp.]